MRPEGAWSATWRDPKEDLALTMTAPSGIATEVILADAEAELKPKHPRTLQYILARNVRQPGSQSPLRSCHITVSEPHRGAAKVSSVQKLKPVGDFGGTTAVAVRAGDHTDLLHSSLDPEAAWCWQSDAGKLEVSAEFASATVD